jgi:hypothetical protein
MYSHIVETKLANIRYFAKHCAQKLHGNDYPISPQCGGAGADARCDAIFPTLKATAGSLPARYRGKRWRQGKKKSVLPVREKPVLFAVKSLLLIIQQ